MTFRMRSMTYGELPIERDFRKAFKQKVGSEGDFEISGPPAERDEIAGSYDEDELWALVQELVDAGDDESMDWASSIMHVLGFEWI